MQQVQKILDTIDSSAEGFVEGVKQGIVAITPESAYTIIPEYAHVVGSIAFKVFKIYTIYSMYEAALSDILCLKTYRHGTNPWAVLSITLRGPDHTRAGRAGEAAFYKTTTGKASEWAERDAARQAFYVVEDVSTEDTNTSPLFRYIETKLTAKYYSLRSTIVFFGSMLPMPKSWKGKVIEGAVKIIESKNENNIFSIIGAICPSVKFHINDENTMNFTRDPGGFEGAMYTQDHFSPLDVGILGVVKNGLFSRRIFTRINEHRGQFLWGIAQLIIAIATTALFYPAFIPGSWIVVAAFTYLYALDEFGWFILFPFACYGVAQL